MSAKIIRLPSGREVLDTGRVKIGILAPEPRRDIGAHAERIQTALLPPSLRPRLIETDNEDRNEN